ncbi:hypothetical protein IID19_00980 [Patescibacteria group bacterium]|nr:hypothetical protein [Patescibacteria group bacterium]
MKKNPAINKNKLNTLAMATPIIIVGIFFSIFFVPYQAWAVTISQLTVEINTQPGETTEQTIQLYDDSLQGITVYPRVFNFTEDPNREGSALVLTDPADLKPDRDWIKFDSNRIDLPNDGTLVDFPYRIEVPPDAEPGTHLISLVFRTRPPTPEELAGSTILIGTNVVTNIFLKVAGATIDQIEADFQSGTYTNDDPNLSAAELKEFFKPKSFFIKPPVEFLLTVHNQGNTHQKPDGNIRIVNDLGLNVPEKLLVNENNRIVLPGTSRTFAVPSYGQGFMFGKYRAKLTLLYGNPLRSLTKEITFWIVPLLEMIILTLFILLLITIAHFRKQRRQYQDSKREKVREQKEEVRERQREQREAEREERLRREIEDLKNRQSPPAEPPPESWPPNENYPPTEPPPTPYAPPPPN